MSCPFFQTNHFFNCCPQKQGTKGQSFSQNFKTQFSWKCYFQSFPLCGPQNEFNKYKILIWTSRKASVNLMHSSKLWFVAYATCHMPHAMFCKNKRKYLGYIQHSLATYCSEILYDLYMWLEIYVQPMHSLKCIMHNA